MWYIDVSTGQLSALNLSSGAQTIASSTSFVSNVNRYDNFIVLPPSKVCGSSTCTNTGLALLVAEPANGGILQTPLVSAPPAAPSTPSGGSIFSLTPLPVNEQDVVVDGHGLIWVNSTGSTLATNFISVVDSNYNEVSPHTNGYIGATALQGNLYVSEQMAIDQSGNLWVVNQNNYDAGVKNQGPYASGYITNGIGIANVTEFIGIATPVNPVLAEDAGNSAYGLRP
jgi:hypothetical protein